MGRTHRIRRRKSRRTFSSYLSSSSCFIKLTQWMKRHGWSPCCKLSPAEFHDTGRGLMAGENILKNQVIVSVPVDLLITISTVAKSSIAWLFRTDCNKQFYAQQVLATFLVWEKHIEQLSSWESYINSVPLEYTTPLFCSDDELSVLPTFVLEYILKQRRKCEDSFRLLMKLFDGSMHKCFHCEKLLKEVFHYEDYKWAWSAVNTRCVYLSENVCKHDLKLKDKDCMALAPYLDMFNHSNCASVEVGLCADKLNYEIRTKVPFSKYSQVFINYGSHSNLKLYTEYGFVLPLNPHDMIPLLFDEVLQYVSTVFCADSKYWELKLDFLRHHALTNDLSCNAEGLSFNLKAVLYVLASNETRKEILTQKIYSYDFDDKELEMIYTVGKQLMEHKCSEFENTLIVMEQRKASRCSKTFGVACYLIQGYLHMLKTSIYKDFRSDLLAL